MIRNGTARAVTLIVTDYTRDADRLAWFEREAKLLASLNHPNIAAIYGLEESNASRFLVLELVDGDTLADRVKRGARVVLLGRKLETLAARADSIRAVLSEARIESLSSINHNRSSSRGGQSSGGCSQYSLQSHLRPQVNLLLTLCFRIEIVLQSMELISNYQSASKNPIKQ